MALPAAYVQQAVVPAQVQPGSNEIEKIPVPPVVSVGGKILL
jgi:hypothetical protein